MRTKLIAACLGLAAFVALAVMPAMASATNTPQVVEGSTPVVVPAGGFVPITATNVGITKMTTSLGTIECTTAILTGDLTKNDTGDVRGDITSAKFGGTGLLQAGAEEPECTTKAFLGGDTTVTTNPATNGLPWCITSNKEMKTDEFQVRGGLCTAASRPIRFALDITNVGTCVYQRTTAIPGTFTTSDDSVLTISEVEFPKFEGPFTCPGSGKLDMSFTLETENAPTFTALGITP